MKPTEIIKQDIARRKGDADRVVQALGILLKSKKGTMLATDDSVLILKTLGEGEVETHLFTVASPRALSKSLKTFADKIRKSDIKIMYGKADNQQIIDFMRSIGFNITPSDRPEYNWRVVV